MKDIDEDINRESLDCCFTNYFLTLVFYFWSYSQNRKKNELISVKYAAVKRYNVVLFKTKDLFLNSMLVATPQVRFPKTTLGYYFYEGLWQAHFKTSATRL